MDVITYPILKCKNDIAMRTLPQLDRVQPLLVPYEKSRKRLKHSDRQVCELSDNRSI